MDVADSIINQSDDSCNTAVDDAIRLEGIDSLSYDLSMDSQLRAGSTVQYAGKQVWGRGKLDKQIERGQRTKGFVTMSCT